MKKKFLFSTCLLLIAGFFQGAYLFPAGNGSDRPADWAQPIDVDGLPNFHRVSGTLFRGAQPDARGMKELAKRGIKTVVNLREYHSDDSLLRGTGLRAVRIPMEASNPLYADAVRFLSVVTDPANQPVFVHCLHGADRTGALCAIYRMAVMNWPKEKAIEEMTKGGFGYHSVFNTSLVPFLRRIDIKQLLKDAGFMR